MTRSSPDIAGAFDYWFDRHFLDPDGGSSHLPDWLKDDLRLAWDAALDSRAAAATTSNALPQEHRNPEKWSSKADIEAAKALIPAGKQARFKGVESETGWFGVLEFHNDPDHFEYRAIYALAPGGDAAQREPDHLLLMQARYVLKNLHAERPGCGYDKLAAACESAAIPSTTREAGK